MLAAPLDISHSHALGKTKTNTQKVQLLKKNKIKLPTLIWFLERFYGSQRKSTNKWLSEKMAVTSRLFGEIQILNLDLKKGPRIVCSLRVVEKKNKHRHN